jgi:chromate reductase, NAD(P)H dehydrogenase (quinone)
VFVLGISGSLRANSFNTALLRAAARLLPPAARMPLYTDLALVPPYSEDHDAEPAPRPVERLRSLIAAADALLIATPEYNASIPGQLKNALDWASRPYPDNALRRKPVAVVGVSTGLFGAVWAQAELRKVLATAGADVLDDEVAIGSAHDAFDRDLALTDRELSTRLGHILVELQSRAIRERPKALAHRREAPRFGGFELDPLVEDFGLVADGDVSLAAGPGVEGEGAVEVRADATQDVDVLGEGVRVPGRDDAPAA